MDRILIATEYENYSHVKHKRCVIVSQAGCPRCHPGHCAGITVRDATR